MTKYEVATIAAINGLDTGETLKLTASQQKELFGFVVAGRKSVSFDGSDQGTVRVSKWTDGSCAAMRSYTYEEFAQTINERKQVEAW